MRERPMSIVLAAVLLVLVSVSDLPLPWDTWFPGAGETPVVVVVLGLVIGIAGIIAAIGLWLLKAWSLRAAVVLGMLNIVLAILPLVGEPNLPPALTAITVAAGVLSVLVVLVLLPSSKAALRQV